MPSAENLREEFDDLSRSDPAQDLVIAEVDGVPVADAGVDRVVRAAGMTEAMLGVDAENPTGALGVYEGLGFLIHQRTTAYARRFER